MSVLFTRRGPVPSTINFVNYIQSSGTQYINTGFNPNQNTRVVMDVEATKVPSSAVAIFGSRHNSSANSSSYSFTMSQMATGTTMRSDFGSTEQTITASTTVVRVVVDKNANICSYGSSSVSHTAETFQSSYPLYLFSVNTAGTARTPTFTGKLYSCKIYDNGTMVRDFRPCYDPDGVACLYDSVDRKYYYNAGSGTFTTG